MNNKKSTQGSGGLYFQLKRAFLIEILVFYDHFKQLVPSIRKYILNANTSLLRLMRHFLFTLRNHITHVMTTKNLGKEPVEFII